MATIDTLASLNSVQRGNMLVLIIEGLTADEEYNIYSMSSDDLDELFCVLTDPLLATAYIHKRDTASYWSNPSTADANGRIIKFFTNFVADDSMNDFGGLTVHDNAPSNSPPVTANWKTDDICGRPGDNRRLAKDYEFSTVEPFEALSPWYVAVDNLVATPGVGEVDLSWDTGTKLDATRGSIEYSVLRRNAAGDPTVGDELVTGLTTTTYTDTTPANGVTYKYRIHARLYWSGFEPYTDDGYLPADDMWEGDMSNIEEVLLGEVSTFTVSMNVRIPMKAPT